ncbi:MAG: DUF1329 domain-containing protein [Rhodanobacteraceae bacterium]|nr:DUF1329 domain-containing protein [Rhodanobacteraceae bacterium]
MTIRKVRLLGAIFGLSIAAGLQAGVPQAQADRLGADLTPMGAEKAGNKEGTIPAWEGGITKPPANYKLGDFHPDPFAADKAALTINQGNYKDYAAKLSVGQQAMFAKYPTFRMDIYPTRRSAAYSDRIYRTTKVNAVAAKMVGEGAGVENVAEGIPFPIPQDGFQVIWNHKMKYRGVGVKRWANQAAPTANGSFIPVRIREEVLGLYWKEGNTIADINNVLTYFYQEVLAPARLAGSVLLVHETLNQEAQPRQAWVYNPGQRRVRKAPNVAYDNPGTASDGLRTNDMFDMFNGALDRFDWKLVGKREMYVPYNDYKIHAKGLDYKDIIKPGHVNPDLMRYELHRVWVVEATLKQGFRHINKRRTFYLDEDSWQILMVDHYDSQEKLWRFSEAAVINFYDQPVLWTTLESHYDLKSGRYITSGIDNMETVVDFSSQATPENFSPQALRTRGVR